jgi:hypothetical protein
LEQLGGDASDCSTTFEADTKIVELYESGQAGDSSSLPEQTKSVTYIENGSYTVTPDDGYTLSSVDINVNVTTPTEVWKVPNGMKFIQNEFIELPEGLDFSEVTNFNQMFFDSKNLTTIPYIDISNGTDFSKMFYDCNKLTTIPLLDTSNGTNFSYMFANCTKLTTIPLIDTSNGTNFYKMFDYCRSLMSLPKLDTSKGTNFGYMFTWFGHEHNEYEKPMIPHIDTSNGTDFSGMFSYSGLVPNYDLDEYGGFPELDVSKGQNFNNMFDDCDWPSILPPLNTVNGTTFEKMFYRCTQLKTIKELNLSKGTNFSNMFYDDYSIKNINLVGSINASIDFSSCTSLTYESVKSILTACSNKTNTNSRTLKFKRTLTDQNGELVNLIATCTSKGWTVSGLTLE